MGFWDRFFGADFKKEIEEKLRDQGDEKAYRDMGMSKEAAQAHMDSMRRRRAENAAATAHWPRDKNGNFL